MAPHIRFGGRKIHLPGSQIGRIALGALLVAGGLVGFLPVLGFWMIPLGFLVLSYDLPLVRRWRRQAVVAWERWRQERSGKSTKNAG
ncbi:MAG: hypothetical protein VX871_12655 [Pseudomonadota bacterium]|nr:hypothetical protein [Pseudomonadota bacterium]